MLTAGSYHIKNCILLLKNEVWRQFCAYLHPIWSWNISKMSFFPFTASYSTLISFFLNIFKSHIFLLLLSLVSSTFWSQAVHTVEPFYSIYILLSFTSSKGVKISQDLLNEQILQRPFPEWFGEHRHHLFCFPHLWVINHCMCSINIYWVHELINQYHFLHYQPMLATLYLESTLPFCVTYFYFPSYNC